MDEHIIQDDDEDRDAIAALSSVPPPQRKIHSYSQQLRATSAQKRYHQVRKNSLDDILKPPDHFYITMTLPTMSSSPTPRPPLLTTLPLPKNISSLTPRPRGSTRTSPWRVAPMIPAIATLCPSSLALPVAPVFSRSLCAPPSTPGAHLAWSSGPTPSGRLKCQVLGLRQCKSQSLVCSASFLLAMARLTCDIVLSVSEVMDLEGNLIAGWVAHNGPVIKLAAGNGNIFSLATHGGLRGWNISSPGPIDSLLRSDLAGKESIYSRQDNGRILIGSWNVGQGRASQELLMSLLGSVASDVGIVVVGLQEVEMGAGFLAMSAAKETGSVGLRIRVFDRLICFVNCHLAAHLEAVNRRNADFNYIYRNMVFSRSSNLLNSEAGMVRLLFSVSLLRSPHAAGVNTKETKLDLAEADMVVFFGDFNYLLFGISYDEARDFVSQRCFDWLREKDQLMAETKAGKVFQGMRGALIRFPPTYKFERHRPGYDSGEKKRNPAWYEACMDVKESDHKPVRCKFHSTIAHVDRSVRRQAFGEVIQSNKKVRSLLDELRYVPETVLSTNSLVFQNQDTSILRITNKCDKDKAIFKIICEGRSTVKDDDEVAYYHPRGSFGLPRWLEVTPAAGIIKPDQFVEVSVHHEEFHTLEDLADGIPQNWWCEDTRDKEVILTVIVYGSCSMETRSHHICVRHCFSAKTVGIDAKSNVCRKGHGGSLHISELRQLSSSSDTTDDPRNSHNP
ncbi:hypothetical protein CRYUN_Cryun08bG0173000 [Craigia yunnanensis]